VTISESTCVSDERLDSGQIVVEPPDGLKNELVPRAELSWASSGRSAVIRSERPSSSL